MTGALGVSANILALPAAGASVRGLSEGFQSDLYSGTGAFDIPISLPAAMGGFAPDVALRYNSGAGAGAFGQGWRLAFPRIQRQTRRGLPEYQAGDDVFTLDGDSDLIPLPDGTFRPEIDIQGMRIRRIGAHWELTDQTGVRHILGATADSRIENPATGDVFAWLVSEIIGPRGQTARFTYRRDGDGRQIERIAYAPFSVTFEYDESAWPRVNRLAGFTVEERLRCTAITIGSARAVREVLRRYRLGYGAGDHRDRLESVELEAGEGSGLVAMPALRLGYSNSGPDAARTITFDASDALPRLGAPEVDLVDLDGCGLPGLIRGAASGWQYWPNLGDGRLGSARLLDDIPGRVTLDQPEVQFADLEGNGTADLLWGENGSQGYFPNAGGGVWEAFRRYADDLPFALTDPRFRLYDTDGDGRIDGVFTGPDFFLSYYNLGEAGWSRQVTRTPRIANAAAFPDVSFADPHVFTADMTGGGLTDIVEIRDGRVCYWPYLDRGRWGSRVEMQGSPVLGPQFDVRRFRIVDANGDGTADLVLLEDDGVRVWRNRAGRGYAPPISIPFPGLGRMDVVVADMLGEGRPGLLAAGPSPQDGSQRYTFLSFGPAHAEGFLTEIRTDLGHVTRIRYGLSSEHRRRGEADGAPWRSFMPFPVVVVDALEFEDLPGDLLSRTSFTYADGCFDGQRRRFNGFAQVTRHVAGDDSQPGLITRAQFHPGLDLTLTEAERRVSPSLTKLKLRSLRGSPLSLADSSVRADGDEMLMSRTRNAYDTRLEHRDGARRVVTAFGTTAETDEIGAGDIRRTVVQRAPPDAFLNPTAIEYLSGRADPVSGDFVPTAHKIERFRYVAPPAPNAVFWAPALRCEESLATPDGEVIRCTRTFFDGAPFVGLPLGQIEAGSISRIEELVETATAAGDRKRFETLGHHLIAPEADDLAPAGAYRNRVRYRNAPDGRAVAVMDAGGAVAEIGYDGWGIDPVRVEDAGGLVTIATYDHQVEQLASITGPDGVTRQHSYDALGRTIATARTSADGSLAFTSVTVHDAGDFYAGGGASRAPNMTTLFPDSPGQSLAALLAAASAPDGTGAAKIVRKVYAACGLETESIVTAPSAATADRYVRSGKRIYNARARIRAESAPQMSASIERGPSAVSVANYTRSYDALGRETLLTFPSGERRQNYDPFTTRLTDANAAALGEAPNVVRHFDAEGRQGLVSTRIDDCHEADYGFTYDLSGGLTSVRDPSGDTTLVIERDRLGRNVRARHRDCGEYAYSYDARGALIRTAHPVRGAIDYGYDALLRMVSIAERDADGSLLGQRRMYYDASPDGVTQAPGRLCAIEDEAGLTRFYYDVRGWLAEKCRILSDGRILRFTYAYNHQGLPVAMTYPDGFRLDYRYGSAGELISIAGFVDQIDYDARGRPECIRYANGIESRIAYDAAERMAAVHNFRNRVEIASFTCDYDATGNPIELTSAMTGAPEEVRRLEYDRLNRLVRSCGERGDIPFDHAFHYDAAGNLLALSEHGLLRFDYADPARPGLLTGIEQDDGSVETRSYDAAGRMVSNAHCRVIAYDLGNRIRRVELADGRTIHFSYDHVGRRAGTRTIATDGTASVLLSFDGLYEEQNGVAICHVRGPGGLIAAVSNDGQNAIVRYHHSDIQGNLRFTTDAAGTMLSQHSYTSFGLELGGADGRFAGKLVDPALAMIQLGHRFYEPRVGRFVTPDLLILETPEACLADPAVFNLYAYAVNNPHRFHDPSGRMPWLIIIGAVIGAYIGYQSARENGTDPIVGAALGALVGGLTGAAGAGVLKGALIGAALGGVGAAVSGEKIWSGAAVGFLFGAIGGVASDWLPAASKGGWSTFQAGLVEVAADGLLAGAAAGLNARLNNKSFEDGFRSGFIMGASLSAVKVLALGARTNPASINKNLEHGLKDQWASQNKYDKYNYLSEKVTGGKMPDPSTVTFRSGGLIHEINGGRSFVGSSSVQMGPDSIADLKSGNAGILAHELRHIAQQNEATFGFVEFIAVWLFQSATSNHQYEAGAENTTLESYH